MMGHRGYAQREWLDHYHECQACHDGPALCDQGAQLASEVMEEMAPDESLLCPVPTITEANGSH